MSPDLHPTECLAFEPPEAQELVWLPLAVRHKLDLAELRLALSQWQRLPASARKALLRLPAGGDFIDLATRSGAVSGSPKHPRTPDIAAAAGLLECDESDARQWLASATPFSRYALAKRIEQICHG